ncbi:MAG: SRPBCC family protein [Candidatus Binataceae bacterium]
MKWPVGFEPDKSKVYARNEIEIGAPPERIWRWIIRAANWSKWYAHAANVTFVSGDPPDLAPDTEFHWSTHGFACKSRVILFEPPYELGWDTRTWLNCFHGWLIVPEESGRCRVIIEVCHNGAVPSAIWWILRPIAEKAHHDWLESLKTMAEAGEPV